MTRKGSLFARIGSALSILSLSLQVTLPTIHEWHEALTEEAYHQTQTASAGAQLKADPSESGGRHHHHHDTRSCGTCATFVSFQHAVVSHSGLPQPPSPRLAGLSSRSGHASSQRHRGLFPPRGPPFA